MLYGIKYRSRIALFISGAGSTLQSLLEMQHQFDIACVISTSSNKLGVLKAKKFGRPVLILEKKINYEKLQFDLLNLKIDRIVLVGFMKILPSFFVDLWKDRMMNIHPSLLPEYPGLDSAFRNWSDQKEMGVTLHHVTAKMDEGPVLLQQKSLTSVLDYSFKEAEIFLRRTEQHLLRELVYKWN